MLTGIRFLIVVTGTLAEELVFVAGAELDPEAQSRGSSSPLLSRSASSMYSVGVSVRVTPAAVTGKTHNLSGLTAAVHFLLM